LKFKIFSSQPSAQPFQHTLFAVFPHHLLHPRAGCGVGAFDALPVFGMLQGGFHLRIAHRHRFAARVVGEIEHQSLAKPQRRSRMRAGLDQKMDQFMSQRRIHT